MKKMRGILLRFSLTVAVLAAFGITGRVADAETLMMPKRDALNGSSVVVWGVTTLANNTSSYSIDFGDGNTTSSAVVTDGSYIALNHTYTAAQPCPQAQAHLCTAKLTVTDRNGASEVATVQLNVYDPNALAADAIRTLHINMAIQDGLRYLWTAQSNRATNFPGSVTTTWDTGFESPAWTSLVTLAFENQGYLLTNNNVMPTGLYEKYVVRRGLNYVISQLSMLSLSVQPAGNPCVGPGIEPAPCVGFSATGDPGYGTAVAVLPIAASGTPSRLSEVPVPFYQASKTFAEILQRLTNTVAWGQIDQGIGEGGWHYSLCNNCFDSFDGSTAGWDLLALLDAGTAGATVASFVPSEFAKGLANTLNDDGTLDYNGDARSSSDVEVNVAKTGVGLQGMFFLGVTASSPNTLGYAQKRQSALDYISGNWEANITGNETFECQNSLFNKGCAYAMFNIFKGLKLQQISTLPGVNRVTQPANDWYADYQDWLVANQNSPTDPNGGNWSSLSFSCCDDNDSANAAMAELVLAPVVLVLPDPTLFGTVGLSQTTNRGIVNGSHSILVTAQSANGTPVAGATVTITVTGRNAQTGSTITNSSGQAVFSYRATGPGVDSVQANIGPIFSNTLTVTWSKYPSPSSTDPNDKDTDDDGYSDYVEVAAGTNPLDTTAHPASGPTGLNRPASNSRSEAGPEMKVKP